MKHQKKYVKEAKKKTPLLNKLKPLLYKTLFYPKFASSHRPNMDPIPKP
jgi:hypothetical protein